jgi:hypothetical protein
MLKNLKDISAEYVFFCAYLAQDGLFNGLVLRVESI